MALESEIQNTVTYLSSNKAFESVEANFYWPKWDSPWWHLLLLFEMGEIRRAPAGIIDALVCALKNSPLKIFPVKPDELPQGLDPFRDTFCHCSLGSIYQVLAAFGVQVDVELPWIRAWFLRYQMSDGGLTCDNDAYLVKDEVPTSMVGTIAPFESILYFTSRDWTPEELGFLNRAAQFLMGRKLTHGSSTKHNFEEQESAKKWVKLCFPRFYFYDVLRGLNAILIWGEKTGQIVPREAISDAVILLTQKFSGEGLKNERLSYAETKTFSQTSTGDWLRRQPATQFQLLSSISALGAFSPHLTQQWISAKHLISKSPHLTDLIR